MIQVKICGITRLRDALGATEAGVDALGFIFHEPSPRFILPVKAREIIALLPSRIVRVGVFVNSAVERVKETADFCGLDIIQLHGDESADYCRHFAPDFLVKAVFLHGADDIARLAVYRVRAFLADFRQGGRYGGTGLQADWTVAGRAAGHFPLILAGGLNETNLAAALAAVRPTAVDLNSGVETAPGIKDIERIKRAVAVVKNADILPTTQEIFYRKEESDGTNRTAG
jgi:phosphoribosylanthranilate isomerase